MADDLFQGLAQPYIYDILFS